MGNRFLDRLQTEIIVLQGAMPTTLQAYGYELDKCFPEWVIKHPAIYQDVHRAFMNSGCDILSANNGGANRLRLRRFGLEDKAAEFTRKLLELTQEIAPDGYFIQGILARTGHYLAPAGDVTLEEMYDIYEEQVMALCDGVDFFRITESDLEVLKIMMRSIRNHSQAPIVAVMGFEPTPKGYRTLVGGDPATNAQILEQAGVDAVGLICGGTGLDDVPKVLEEMKRSCSLPLVAKPNAGRPQLVDGKTIHPVTPEQMGEAVGKWVACGARIVGGCCGTTPDHIARIAAAAKQH